MSHSQFRQFEVVHIVSSVQTVWLCTCWIISTYILSLCMLYTQFSNFDKFRQFYFIHASSAILTSSDCFTLFMLVQTFLQVQTVLLHPC